MKPLSAPGEVRTVLRALGGVSDDAASDQKVDQLEQLEAFAGWLAGPGIERGLLGPRERDRIWTRHVINSALLVELLPGSASVCDLGSGAGLPGVVLAVLRPDLTVTLLEPLLRRSQFLAEVVDDLDLPRTIVRRARAEDYAAARPDHDVVVARAVAPLPRLLTWSMPLLRPGGELLALKGETAAAELAAAAPGLRRLGAADGEVCTLGAGGNVTHAVRVVRPNPAGPPPVGQIRTPTEDR